MTEYGVAGALRRSDLDADPIVEFGRWLDRARSAGLIEPTAASLATADAAGRPSGRMVLLKGVDPRGFVFYTNYESRKAVELAANPRASLHLWWDRLERQVRVEGEVSRLEEAESDAYFAARPRGSQLGAWASAQSRAIGSRRELEDGLRAAERRFADREIPRPPHWGGFRIRPEAIEFWQGRRSRLHDRFRYRLENGGWVVDRLSP